MSKKPGAPRPTIYWAPGPALVSRPAELMAWFEAQQRGGAPLLTRVPIVLRRGPGGFSSRGVRLGTLFVYVTDAALGIGITDRARRATGGRAAFLAEGFWRGHTDAGLCYELRYASSQPLSDAELAAITHVEVEDDRVN